MSLTAALLLLLTGFTAGIVNPIAGGGSFIIFPALLFSGLDARAANISVSIALLPMQLWASRASWNLIKDAPQMSFKSLVLISLSGSLIGTLLLLSTPGPSFAKLVPWFVLFATALFALGSYPSKLIASKRSVFGTKSMILFQTCVSIYGGYFGAGSGLLMLAALTLSGMPTRHAAATKNILSATINVVSVAFFSFSKDAAWPQVALVALGAIAGSHLGIKALKFINERTLRISIIIVGLALTIALFQG